MKMLSTHVACTCLLIGCERLTSPECVLVAALPERNSFLPELNILKLAACFTTHKKLCFNQYTITKNIS